MPVAPGSPGPTPWPLTGRSEEIAYVRGVRRGDDPPSVLVLGGGQGVGRSRLAHEALAEAGAERWLTERIDGAAATSAVPFGAIAHLAPPEAAGDPLRLLASTADHLAQRAARRPLMVLVDDAHQLDEASLAVLRRVATVPRLFLLLTIRSDVPVPAPLVALWKDGLAHRVELQPLSRDETYGLVTAVLRAGVDPAALRWYWDNTLGNPLYLRELLLADQAGATLREMGGTWARTEHGRGGARRLGELVESRLGRIDPAWRPALEALSLTGPLPAGVVAGLAAAGALDGLTDQGLLTTHAPGGGRGGAAGSTVVHLAHPIYGVVLRDGLDPVRADRLRRQVLDAFDALPDRSPSETVRLVTLRLDHGVEVDTPQLVTAARYAQAASSQAVAERLRVGSSAVDRITAAVADAGSATPPPSEEDLASAERLAAVAWGRDRAQAAGLALTTILIARGKADAAEKLVTELEAQADAPADRAQLALARAALLFWVRGRPDEALDVLRTAEATSVDPDAIRRLQRLRAGIALNVGQVGEAVDVATRLMDAAGPADPFGALAAATAAAGLTLAGRPHDAVAIVDRHLAVAQAHVMDIPEAIGQLLLARVQAARVLGDLDSAEWFAYACYQTAADHGALGAMAVFVGALGQVALDRGRPLTATRRLREAEVLLRERDSFGYRPLVLAHLTMALAQSGGAGDAAPVPPPGPAAGHERFFDADLLLADAWRLAADGRLDHAVATALAAAERARAAGLAPAEALALHAVVRFGNPGPVVARARELAVAVGSPFLDACAAHAAAAAAADGTGLDDVAASFAGLGARLLAAEAADAAAVIHDRQGDRGAAYRSRARSKASAEDCEGATTPALRLAARAPLLTAREHEVAVLAAGGLTSKAVAERLVVSPRTVESHLYRIFAKLGVEDRSQLADVLGIETP